MLVLLLALLRPASAALPPAAADALAMGDCAAAVQQVPRPAVDAERLAIARCHVRLGQPRQAMELLNPALAGPLAGYAALVAGEASLALGRPNEAAEVLAKAARSGESGQRAAMLRGRALVESGRYAEARELLRPLLEGDLGKPGYIPSPLGPDPAEIRWWLAEGARLRGEPEKAAPVWKSIWTDNPTSPWAVQAANRLAAHDKAVPDAGSDAGRALIAARARALQKMSLPEEALALLDLLPPDDTQPGVRKQAEAAFAAKNYVRAVAAYGRLAAPTPEDRFQHALATSRTGNYTHAAQLYSALFKAHPAHARGDEASFKVGYLAYDAAQLPEAVALLRQHLGRYPSSRYADEARWFIGWSLYRLDKVEEADAVFEELLRAHAGSGLAPAARYWQARISGQRGDKSGETAGYEEVLRRWPASGYAWYAAWRMDKTWPRQPLASPPAAPAALKTAGWSNGVALAAVGLDGWAREQLAPLKAKATTREGKLALAYALIDAGAYTEAAALAQPFCGAPEKGGDPAAMQACYPRPAGGLVDRLAQSAGLDRNLPYAIMHTESSLRPEVSSPAGARGLMQLMPNLGRDLHAARGFAHPYDPDDLYRPGYNAALGVTELGRLKARFGTMTATIAGYNGGAEAVARWLAIAGGTPEPDRFAEDVGYTETRRYVRRVLGHVQAYRYVYGD